MRYLVLLLFLPLLFFVNGMEAAGGDLAKPPIISVEPRATPTVGTEKGVWGGDTSRPMPLTNDTSGDMSAVDLGAAHEETSATIRGKEEGKDGTYTLPPIMHPGAVAYDRFMAVFSPLARSVPAPILRPLATPTPAAPKLADGLTVANHPPGKGETVWSAKSVANQVNPTMAPTQATASVGNTPTSGYSGLTDTLAAGEPICGKPSSYGGALPIASCQDNVAGSAPSPELTEEAPITTACFKISADVELFCIPDSDPEEYFYITVLSVMEQESGFNPNAFRVTNIAGVDYEVRGCLQILLDGATRPLIASMGYTPDDLYDCAVSIQVAHVWYERTNRGVPWRQWVARPTYLTDGHD